MLHIINSNDKWKQEHTRLQPAAIIKMNLLRPQGKIIDVKCKKSK